MVNIIKMEMRGKNGFLSMPEDNNTDTEIYN